MPKSDTWPGGIAMDMMGEMDSAESCDSVVSINSCFSDDSLQYLSAEEKACLMFLEETIESLDTEDDSGLSNDEEEHPAPGNVAAKTAFLSASMDQSKYKDVPKHYLDDPRMFGSSEHNQILNYLVPTPFVLANSNAHILPKPGTSASKEKLPLKEGTDHQHDKTGPPVPSEVNVVVIPPPFTVKSISERDRELQNDRPPRGPLTYEGLVQLRTLVSSRKNLEDEMSSTHQVPVPSNDGTQAFSQQNQCKKTNPPVVAPKPKKIPSHLIVLNHKGTASPNADSIVQCLSTSPRRSALMKPEKVRLEALSKLGLLKESNAKTFTKGCPTETCIPSPLNPSSNSVPDLLHSSSCPPCVAVRSQEMKSQPSQSSSILHHGSMTEVTTAPSCLSAGGKVSTLERSGVSLGSSMSNVELSDRQSSDCVVSQNHQQCSSTMVLKNSNGNSHKDTYPCSTDKAQAPKGSSTVPQKALHVQGLNVLKVPNMGDDRREALRKLGLLKN